MTGPVNTPQNTANNLSSNWHDKKKQDSPTNNLTLDHVKSIAQSLKQPGVHSKSFMAASGFRYTNNGDEARCDECKLELSNWSPDVHPFIIHSKQRPDCPFVCSKTKSMLLSSLASSATTAVHNKVLSNEPENPSKRLKIESVMSQNSANTLFETDSARQIRKRTFSHWPQRILPSPAQMIEAGFFNCNVGDRVICIYCNLICQQWTPHTDDPCEVHKTLSPKCIYVIAKLVRPPESSIVIVNEPSIGTGSTTALTTAGNLDPLRSNEIVFTAACNPAYTEIPKRHASFATWPAENLPSVDDLVRAGFFYTGTKTIVTCFYCNGSLQNWGANDNPTIEHARWFPNCAYAKQLCGDDLYRKIQESKRAQQERVRANEQRERTSTGGAATTNSNTDSRQLLIPDESTLSRLVAARLDLPISQRLLDQGYKLSVIKRCWEDQLRLKQDDFQAECDLYIACLILQKQIEHIDGKKENIVIPSIKMKQIREQNEAQLRDPTSTSAPAAITRAASNTTDIDMTATSQSLTNESTSSQSSDSSASKPTPTVNNSSDEAKNNKSTPAATSNQDPAANSSPANPCVLCLTEEKRLACIPCGHLATCVPCGHSLRSCPICRREIEAFVRIYI